ncbi:MAG: UvrD-helicase domain-containing protein, partial [Actinomycetota bacterium]|nr:UvrD-helicase domain-containing protein [Actinomycetota bacterium]
MSATYRLAFPPPVAAAAPVLDEAQRAVVRHRGGPLLVLAGPGTGKTTTIVEAVVDRVSEGLAPDRVLVLTFSRRAAAELRERITARLGVTVATPAAWTFHAFCYALVRAYGDAQPGSPPVRLLSAPEQDVVVRDLLSGSAELDTVPWPLQLRASLRTRGLAEEVRGVLARCREVGLEPTGLAQLAAQADRDDWTAVAAFFAEYLDVLDALGALDYAELVHRAVSIAGRPDVRADLRARFPVVFVDEYQDTDPAQEALLGQLAGDGRNLVVVGDPDQAIYAFRGADVDGLLRFPERFPTADRSPAPILSLRTSRRAGTALLSASRAVARRLSLHGLPTAALREHRELLSADSLPAGEVTVRTYPSAGAEAEAVADLLRRAHLETGLPWARMAVLVRSGVRSIPLLRRVLSAAGVPLEVAGDELPLAREPGVAPLLLALRCADEPAELTAERARALLLSPLVGADPAQLRRLGRALREAERASLRSQDGPEHLPRSSSELIREAVAAPLTLGAVPDTIAAPAQRLGALLDRARAALAGVDGSPEQALWELWSGSAWSRRLPAAADRGGAGGRAADRDLDA